MHSAEETAEKAETILTVDLTALPSLGKEAPVTDDKLPGLSEDIPLTKDSSSESASETLSFVEKVSKLDVDIPQLVQIPQSDAERFDKSILDSVTAESFTESLVDSKKTFSLIETEDFKKIATSHGKTSLSGGEMRTKRNTISENDNNIDKRELNIVTVTTKSTLDTSDKKIEKLFANGEAKQMIYKVEEQSILSDEEIKSELHKVDIFNEKLKSSTEDFSLSRDNICTSAEELYLSGKSTPDIADVEKENQMKALLTHEKPRSGHSTPPTAPVSPISKLSFRPDVQNVSEKIPANEKSSEEIVSSVIEARDLVKSINNEKLETSSSSEIACCDIIVSNYDSLITSVNGDIVTKTMNIGDDFVTQKISTMTEKSRQSKEEIESNEAKMISGIQHSVGKFTTETDTTTKIIKEGENLVTQTVTTVTTKEIVSKEDGTPQSIKTTIETTTISKGSDGSTKTTKDTKTTISECSSTLKSSSALSGDNEKLSTANMQITTIGQEIEDKSDQCMSLHDYSHQLENLQSVGEKTCNTETHTELITKGTLIIKRLIIKCTTRETMSDINLVPKKIMEVIETTTVDEYPDGSINRNVDKKVTVSDYSNIIDDNLSDEILEETSTETNVKINIIKINSVEIKQTVTTVTKRDIIMEGGNRMKKLRTTVETTTINESPDKSIETFKDVKVSISDIRSEQTSSLENLLKSYKTSDKIESSENKTTNTIKKEGYNIVQTITTITTVEELEDEEKITKKIKTTIKVVTADEYPDGSVKTTIDTKVSISDVAPDINTILADQIIEDDTEIEDSNVTTDAKTYKVMKEGKEIVQTVTVVTTRDILASSGDDSKKVRTTVETTTVNELPEGTVETTKDIKVTISEYKSTSSKSLENILKDLKPAGDVETTTEKESERINKSGIEILRTITTITSRQEFCNKNMVVQKLKTIVETITVDEYPDGAVETTKDRKITLADVQLSSPSPDNDLNEPDIADEDIEDTHTDTEIVTNVIEKGSQQIKQTITTVTTRDTLSGSNEKSKKIRTTVETTTVDEYPDGSTETTKDIKITVSENQTTSSSELNELLKHFKLTGKIKSETDTKSNTIVQNGEEIKQVITTVTTKEEMVHDLQNSLAVKIITETTTTNESADGSIETIKDVRTQITYLPSGLTLDDLDDQIEKMSPKDSEESPKIEKLEEPPQKEIDNKPIMTKSKQSSPIGEKTTETEVFTKTLNEDGDEIVQTITVVTTREIISPEKVKVTVETTTVSKGKDGYTKTTKATKTTISEYTEEFVETIDRDIIDSSSSSQMAHSPPLNLSFEETDAFKDQIDISQGFEISKKSALGSVETFSKDMSSEENLYLLKLHRKNLDPMSTSVYGALPGDDEPATSFTETEDSIISKESHSRISSSVQESYALAKIESNVEKKADHRFLDEADIDFEKALEQHRLARGADLITSITSKYQYPPTEGTHGKEDSSNECSLQFVSTKETQDKLSESHSASSSLSTTSTMSITKMTIEATETAKSESKTLTKKTAVKDPIEGWGKPLGLPSPAPPSNGNDSTKTTPKKEKKTPPAVVNNKNKINQEKTKESRKLDSPSRKKKIQPIYMDLTYVPHHGNSYYSAVEFFKRVRARYYVFSGTEPSKEIYNALLEAKQTWEDKDLEVTIIPTYDTDVLGYWVTENEELLEKYKIDLSPSASRCTINLQDHETSCSAYRLEF